MLRNIYKILLLIVGLATSIHTYSQQFIGGEIRWECLANGNYRFVTILYRECAAIQFPNSISLNSNSPAGNIALQLYPNTIQGKKDISPVCNADTNLSHIECGTTPFGSQYANSGAIQQWVYTSDFAYPNGVQLNGVPPPGGWEFTYSGCCRKPVNNISSAGNTAWFLRSVMKPFKNQSAYPCLDNAPVAAEPPQSIYCSSYPSSYYQYTEDKELDDISYSWESPVDGNSGLPISSYISGYSYDNPLPDASINPKNKGAFLDTLTGMISFKSYTPGSYLIGQKITSRREGIVIAEIYREFNIFVFDCDTANLPPVIKVNGAILPDSLSFLSYAAIPGDTVKLNLSIYDTVPHYLSNGEAQSTLLTPMGQQFGTGFTSSTGGCPVTPCATLSTPPPYFDSIPMNIQLKWPITIDHMFGQNGQYLGYTLFRDFNFRLQDDFCPLPGMRNLLFRVKLDLSPVVQKPAWYCIQHDSLGITKLEWDTVGDPFNLFISNKIYVSTSNNGPWTLLDSITDPNITSYQMPNPSAVVNQQLFFKMVSEFDYVGTPFEVEAFTTESLYPSGPSSSCVDESFVITLQGMKDGDSISIDPGIHGLVLGFNGANYTLQYDQPGQYYYTVYRWNSCGMTSIRRSITVHDLPTPTLISPTYACPGQPTTLTSAPAVTYLWSTGSTSQSISLPPLPFHQYVGLEVTDSNGCTNAGAFFIPLVHPYPDESICMVSVSPTDGKPEVIWEKTEGAYIKAYNIDFANNQSPANWSSLGQAPFSTAGIFSDSLNDPAATQLIYRIQVIDSCDNTSMWSTPAYQLHLKATRNGNDVYVSWLPPQNISFSSVRVLRQHNGGPFTLLDSVFAPANAYLDLAPPSGNLAYRAEIHGINCEPYPGNIQNTLYSNTAQPVNPGIEEFLKNNEPQITIDPSRKLIIAWNEVNRTECVLSLFDVIGKEVLRVKLRKGVDQQSISLSNIKAGIYIAGVYSKGKALNVKKVIIY